MRGTTRNQPRIPINQQNSQENQHERKYRPPIRRKYENDHNDIQPQRAQRVDYNRLKRERAQEVNNQKQNNNSNNAELLKYAHSFHYQSENNNDIDEPAHAKKLVIVNNKADRIGSGRFSQQQRTQERGQHKREERMRRCTIPNNGHTGGANEFHLDVPPMPIWQNGPMSVQLLPTNINGHHTGMDHLVNTSEDQIDQSAYIHNFAYPSPAQVSSVNSNGTIYFAHSTPSMTTGSTSSQTTTHFHQYHSARTFENSNQHQFHLPSFQSSPIFQSPLLQPSVPVSSTSNNYQEQENLSTDFSSNIRRIKPHDHENKLFQQRPMSGDFERLQNTHHVSSSRFNNDHRFQSRPQSFYDFSSHQQSNNNNNNNNNNFFRSSNNNRYQRNNNINNNNTSLPLSAYMTTDDSLNENDNIKHTTATNNNNHWGASYQKRRSTQQRAYHQDKHQFPLSLYDPRQYGFNNNNNNNNNNNYQRRNDLNNRPNINRRNINNNRNNNNEINGSSGIDIIEEWWEDNNTELIGTKQSTLDTDAKRTIVDDSGNSSLSTSMNLKESTLDDMSINDFVNPPSNVSTTDSNIIESIDKLQQQLKLEEAVDERLASTNNNFVESIDNKSNKEEIQQHDFVTTDDDDNDNDNDNDHPSTTNSEEKLDALEDDLNEKLTIDENLSKVNQSVVVE
ncbi:unnamed protein product [Rotaria sp. Silwood2]|nr:unnamed protein product [Rotaria sp. Silwood2]CAF4123890.1 unnamed protein product [Rotaria sp. Silwood2]